MKSLKFYSTSTLLAIVYHSIFKISENSTQDSILGIILSVFVSILIFSKIRKQLERSLNNLADAVIIFELISFPALLLFLNENFHTTSSQFNIIDLLYSFLFSSVIALRLLSTCSGAILCWKLIRNRNQGGPYSIRARVYQGIAAIAWLIQVIILVVVIFLPDLLGKILYSTL